MQNKDALKLLRKVQSGEITPNDALLQLKLQPFEDLGYAKIDTHRSLRQGVPEVIFGQNKTPEQIAGIVESMQKGGLNDILISRMTPEAAAFVGKRVELEYYEVPRLGIALRDRQKALAGLVVVASGCTRRSAAGSSGSTTWAWPGCTGYSRIWIH